MKKIINLFLNKKKLPTFLCPRNRVYSSPMFDPILMAKALEANASPLQAVAYAHGTWEEWMKFAADNPDFFPAHQHFAAATGAAAKVALTAHIKGSPSFDEALRYLGITEPKDYGPKANLNIAIDKPFILLPTHVPLPDGTV